MSASDSSRRDFLKKAAYVAPVVLTMNVSLAEAQVGSAPAPTAPSDSTFIQASTDYGTSEERALRAGSRHQKHQKHAYRGRGHAYGRLRREDD